MNGEEGEPRSGEYGIIDLGGGWGLVNVLDRDGGRLWLPVKNVGGDFKTKMGRLGYLRAVPAVFSDDNRQRLGEVVGVLPPLLAVDLVMNRRGGVEQVPERSNKVLIGVEGGPHSGKTMAIIIAVLCNEGVVSAVDLDPFSNQSFSVVYRRVKTSLAKNRINPKTEPAGIVNTVLGAYQGEEARLSRNVTLRGCLDDLWKAWAGDDSFILADLPGEDQKTERYDIFHLLRCGLTTINMNGRVRNVPTEKPILGSLGDGRPPHGEIYYLYGWIRANLGSDKRFAKELGEGDMAVNRERGDRWQFAGVVCGNLSDKCPLNVS